MSPRHVDSQEIKPCPTKLKIGRRCDKVYSSTNKWLGKTEAGLKNDLSLLTPEKLRETYLAEDTHVKYAARKVPKHSPRLPIVSKIVSTGTSSEISKRNTLDTASLKTDNPRIPLDSTEHTMAKNDRNRSNPKTPNSGKRKRTDSQDIAQVQKFKSAKKNLLESDEIIEVDDSETPPSKTSRALRSATALTDHCKLCEYPLGTKDSVSVCLADYKTLEYDTFLNDIIIDFYLTYLFHIILSKDDKPTVHIFSTMFYKRLNSTPKKASTVASYEKDANLLPAQKRHLRVKGWTKNVNLFEKNMVIIPICEHSHWYLVIAIRPGLIKIPIGSEERQTKGEPFMIVLDSMGGNKTAAVSNIRHYLAAEWKAKMCGENDEDEYEFTSKQMRTIRPLKPEQENYSDCGIYLLQYIEKIFQSVGQFYWPGAIQDLSNWFSIDEVVKKRDEIARLIRGLTKDQNGDKELTFPSIRFLPPDRTTRSKTRKKEYEHQSSESEDDSWGKGQTLGGQTMSIAASGFYGERSKHDSSKLLKSDVSGFNESDVNTGSSKGFPQEEGHSKIEFRSKDAGSARLSKDNLKDSRQKLNRKIRSKRDIEFDLLKDYIPESKKNDGGSDELSSRRKKYEESGKSVRLEVMPSIKPMRVRDVGEMALKSKGERRKEISCAAELSKIEAEEGDDDIIGRKVRKIAVKAFKHAQKASHDITANHAEIGGSSKREAVKEVSLSLPTLKKKLPPEKRKVLQHEVLEDLMELEEEGNHDEGVDKVCEKVNLEVESCPSKTKDAFSTIVTEKVTLRDGRELSKVASNIEENFSDHVSYVDEKDVTGSCTDPTEEKISVTRIEDTPEITTIDSGSEVTTLEDVEDRVEPIENDFPLVGFLEKVDTPEELNSHEGNDLKSKTSKKNITSSESPMCHRKSTSEPDSPTRVFSKSMNLENKKHVSDIPFSSNRRNFGFDTNFDRNIANHKPSKSKLSSEQKIVEDQFDSPTFSPKSTSEQSQSRSTSEPVSPILSRKKDFCIPEANSIVLKKKNKVIDKIHIDSDSDDGGNSSGSDCSYVPETSNKAKALQTGRRERPKREKKFSNLSEIERAKLKNIPTDEREKILAKRESRTLKGSADRNQLSKDNPFSDSSWESRTLKPKEAKSSDLGNIDFKNAINEIDSPPIRTMNNSKKRFRLQEHGKIFQDLSGKCQTKVLDLDPPYADDSGSDCTDILAL